MFDDTVTKKLTLSGNQKLISINWKVWKCLNFLIFQVIESKKRVSCIWHGGIISKTLYRKCAANIII